MRLLLYPNCMSYTLRIAEISAYIVARRHPSIIALCRNGGLSCMPEMHPGFACFQAWGCTPPLQAVARMLLYRPLQHPLLWDWRCLARQLRWQVAPWQASLLQGGRRPPLGVAAQQSPMHKQQTAALVGLCSCLTHLLYGIQETACICYCPTVKVSA